MIVRQSLREVLPDCVLNRVSDGQQAIRYLNGEGEYSARDRFPFPELLLLDLRLPVLNGFELLAWVHAQTRLRGLPVIILSGSPLPFDINRTMEFGVRYYFTKTAMCEEAVSFISKFATGGQLPPPNLPRKPKGTAGENLSSN